MITRHAGSSRISRVAVLTAHEGSASWRELLAKLEESGRVTIRSITAYSDQVYRSSTSGRQRAWLRIKTYLLYPILIVLSRRRLSQDFDTIIVITAPFFLPALASAVLRGPRIVALQNDIYPEALIVKKLIRRGGILDRAFSAAIAAGLRRCATVVYITDEHRQLVARLLGSHANEIVIPVPSSLKPAPIEQRLVKSDDRLTALYAGTLGTMHETSTFLRYMHERTPPPKFTFKFRTSGAGKREFERVVEAQLSQQVAHGLIELGGALSDAEWTTTMLSAEIGLVFQNAGAGDVVFPSKAASILVAGQALLAIADKTSSLGRLVTDFDCGWLVDPGDVDSFEVALREAAVPSILERKRTNARQLGRERFALDVVAEQWLALLLVEPSAR